MNRMNRLTGPIVAAALGLATMTSVAQTTANGPFYATPSWDQTIASGSRFVVLSNFNGDAVLDRETGLVWEKAPYIFNQPFDNANFTCLIKATGGRYGWRMPTYAELTSLLEANHFGNFPIPAGHPFVLPSSVGFWSSTAAPSGGSHFSLFSSPDGTSFGTSFDSAQFVAWCVRGSDR